MIAALLLATASLVGADAETEFNDLDAQARKKIYFYWMRAKGGGTEPQEKARPEYYTAKKFGVEEETVRMVIKDAIESNKSKGKDVRKRQTERKAIAEKAAAKSNVEAKRVRELLGKYPITENRANDVVTYSITLKVPGEQTNLMMVFRKKDGEANSPLEFIVMKGSASRKFGTLADRTLKLLADGSPVNLGTPKYIAIPAKNGIFETVEFTLSESQAIKVSDAKTIDAQLNSLGEFGDTFKSVTEVMLHRYQEVQ